MRRNITHILVVCSLLLLLIVTGCGPEAEEARVIKIGVIGPMQFVQGEHHWYGAVLARDEINDAGGVKVGEDTYTIELIKTDSNEILSPSDSAAAMERLITVDKANFVVGGFRTEAVFPMQDVAMDNKTIFLGCGAATEELCTRVADDYDTYKYWFRVSPFNNVNLVSNSLLTLGMAGGIMAQGLGLEPPLKVAIIAEKATWADAMVAAYKQYVPAMLGMEVVGDWRPSATATDLTAELTDIENSGAHLILTIISGPVGIPYARQLGELEIPAASVGINVEAQKDGFWEATGGQGDYETTLNTYAEGVAVTDSTVDFFDKFVKEFGQTPTYNSGTYDAIYTLKEAIERAGSLDSDAVVTELEKTDRVGTAGRLIFMGRDTDTPHDVTYGPGYVTGIATQWQDGEMKAVWPAFGVGAWEGVTYDGIVMWKIPDRVIKKYAGQ
ncbi:MAG TPA: ABC transporter substrate-binding protein [Dehalococcoidia bacterium]|nr:ABC transporter substrate-binding protein [Dehalococcoidia bacterium]